MYPSSKYIPLLLSFLPLALTQATTTSSAATSTATSIVDFSALPSCATDCGPLYDANGACTPPHISTVSVSCFCAYSTLQPFLTTTAGVCDNACTADSTGLSNIQSWFQNLCGDSTSSTSSASGTATGASATSTGSATKFVNHNSGSAWIHYHYRWIIMVIILIVGIIAIWVAACMFRKRHIAKKEKEYELTHPVPLGPDGKPNYAAAYPPNTQEAGKVPVGAHAGDAAMMEKGKGKGKDKAKWIVKERT